MRRTESIGGARDKLVGDFQNIINDAEGLLRATAHFSGEGLAAARAKLEDQLEQVRTVVTDAQEFATQSTKKAATTTDRYVHQNPWQAIGAAMAVGILIGYISRGR